MTETARSAVDAGAPRLWPGFALLVGAAMLVLLLLHPGFDESWENHPAHFWLVLTAASLSVVSATPSEPPLQVKGKGDPIEAYVLHGLAPT
jgi:hypothetical protein